MTSKEVADFVRQARRDSEPPVLRDLDLSCVEFRSAKFSDVVFVECSLTCAVFSGAHLYGTRFVKCHARGAIFSGADLRFAEFTDCFLAYARFKEADLAFASFAGSSLIGANLTGARFNSQTAWAGCELDGAVFFERKDVLYRLKRSPL